VKGKHYTKDEIRYLKENAQNLEAKAIAKTLGRSESSVFNKAMKLGISLKKVSHETL